jgi:hypothetical protein
MSSRESSAHPKGMSLVSFRASGDHQKSLKDQQLVRSYKSRCWRARPVVERNSRLRSPTSLSAKAHPKLSESSAKSVTGA